MQSFREFLDEITGSPIYRSPENAFSAKQIVQLRKAFPNKMSYKRGLELKNMMSKYPTKVLKQLEKEDIPWISMFAGLQLKKR